ncbi:MAG TPA: pyrroline-5-carboxylate reductase [Dehalococcoidia bacterium]|nr:pyrroline-5-carboxylate reductase [Dehalococcoidia bacterium]
MRVCFIGGGVMGEAMVKSLLTKGKVKEGDIVVSDVSKSRRELLKEKYGVEVMDSNRAAAEKADIVVLAVKPQELGTVLADLKGLSAQQLVLSIVAGATLGAICQGLSHSRVVRAMPNMPAQIGEGVTMWTAMDELDQKHKEMARLVLGALGDEIYVGNEKYIDMATALSGSGPAYVFLIIEALVDAGVHIGLPRDIAERLVVKTVLGSAWAVEVTGKHPAELRNMVTSPGGTTTEGLLQLEAGGLRSLLLKAVIAAYTKAKALATGQNKP